MTMKITLEFATQDTSLFSTIAELAVEVGAVAVNVDMTQSRGAQVTEGRTRMRRTNNNLVHNTNRGIDVPRSLAAFGISEDEAVRSKTSRGTALHRLKMAILAQRRQPENGKPCDIT